MMMSFREKYCRDLDAAVAKARAEHPEWPTWRIADSVGATIGELQASKKRLGIVMKNGRPYRLQSETAGI